MPRTRTTTTTSAQARAAASNPRAAANAPGPSALLRTTEGAIVPLQGVTAHGRLEGLIFELTVEQRYRNDTDHNLEAVFTFPLPLRAVLLGFDLEIGERKLKAHAVAKQEAAEEYEEAIDQGNTAALIEHDGNGLYTVSLGNLMAGEGALIRYRYAELLDAHDGHVRLNVPTVIAPRYGKPADAGLEGPAIPDVDLLGEYPFELSLDLKHVTNVIGLRSPSHSINTIVRTDGLTVTLSRSGFLDRDFVLELDQAAIPPHVLIAEDGDGYVALASATLALDTAESRPLALKILLDCSGSMGGDSIAAAKRALLAILDRLTPNDRISLTRFGSSIDPLTEGLEPADEHSLHPLKSLVRRIEADLGGTEMEAALQCVLALAPPQGQQADVILITDGEIYDVAGVVELAARSHHRLFAIAIGAAPNEALARSLSDQTGGACEFVGPFEDAEAAILRTFKRLRSTPRTVGTVQWPSLPNWNAPNPSAVFPGDTLHLLAGFTSHPSGSIDIRIRDGEGQGTAIHLDFAPHLTDGDLLPRLAAARRLASLDEDEGLALAVKYQLATKYTSFVIVAERMDGEKATDLPTTVAVPHMLAAGWGGSALVMKSIGATAGFAACMPAFERMSSRRCDLAISVRERDSFPLQPPTPEHRQSQLKLLIARGKEQGFLTYADVNDHLPSAIVDPEQIEDIVRLINDMGIPVLESAPSPNQSSTEPPTPTPTPIAEPTRSTPLSANELTALLESLQAAQRRGEAPPTGLQALCDEHPLPAGVREALRELQRLHGRSEVDVVAVFLSLLAQAGAKEELLDSLLATLRSTLLGSRSHRALRRDMRMRLFP